MNAKKVVTPCIRASKFRHSIKLCTHRVHVCTESEADSIYHTRTFIHDWNHMGLRLAYRRATCTLQGKIIVLKVARIYFTGVAPGKPVGHFCMSQSTFLRINLLVRVPEKMESLFRVLCPACPSFQADVMIVR